MEQNKRRKIAEIAVKQSLYVLKEEVQTIDNASFVVWQDGIAKIMQTAREQCTIQTEEFLQNQRIANKDIGVHAPIDFNMWCQTRAETNSE